MICGYCYGQISILIKIFQRRIDKAFDYRLVEVYRNNLTIKHRAHYIQINWYQNDEENQVDDREAFAGIVVAAPKIKSSKINPNLINSNCLHHSPQHRMFVVKCVKVISVSWGLIDLKVVGDHFISYQIILIILFISYLIRI